MSIGARNTTRGQRATWSGRLRGLDGLRGLALVGMLAWHANLEWVRGGFARMTIFFVLSGYLATRSMLKLREDRVPSPMWSFWNRRIRRLLPLTLVGVAAAIAVTLTVGSGSARSSLGGDTSSVIMNVSNWRFMVEGRSYGHLFDQPSAFQHFWSLSAEEQCFWLLPSAVAAGVALTRRWWILAATMAVALVASPAAFAQTPDVVYYGTHIRGGEFLVGVALAGFLAGNHQHIPTRLHRLVRAGGAAGLAALLVVMAAIDRSTEWLYRGGLALTVVPVVAVIAAVLTGGGIVDRCLSTRPLVTLGRWAFSIYVLHWPIYLVLSSDRVGASGATLAMVQMAVAIAVGAVVHRYVERPLLPHQSTAGSVSNRRWRSRLAISAMVAVGVGLMLVAWSIPSAPTPTYDFALAQARANTPPSTTVPPSTVASLPARRLTLGVYGGSTGVVLGAAFWEWSATNAVVNAAPAWSRYGCGFITGGERIFARAPDGSLLRAPPDDECIDWEQNWVAATQQHRIQVALVVTGVWETSDWIFTGKDSVSTIDDQEFDQLLRFRLDDTIRRLNDAGAVVVFATAPQIGPGADGNARASRGLPDEHPARVSKYNALLRDVAAARGRATVLDYGAFLDSLPKEQSSTWLPDGIHPTDDAARQIWTDYLGPAVEQTVRQTWPDL